MNARDILVVGAGVMGMGIAQVAAQSGHRVFLYDQREGAAFNAVTQIDDVLRKLVTKNRIEESDARKTIDRLISIPSLADARSARVAIEAIVEKLEPKRALLRELESLLGPTAILATNTSSISVTALAAGLEHPERVVGMHFFNPVPLMALVEVVSGLRTAADAAAEIERLARAWGKVPVHARSTPGFIVNRIARPFYAESLMLLREQAAKPHEIDGLLRAAGFRMGPCELMDLIGHDTNFAVTQSVFEAGISSTAASRPASFSASWWRGACSVASPDRAFTAIRMALRYLGREPMMLRTSVFRCRCTEKAASRMGSMPR